MTREMGTATSCTKCSQMADFILTQVECTLPYASKISAGTVQYCVYRTESSHLLVRKRQFEFLALAESEDLFDIKRQ